MNHTLAKKPVVWTISGSDSGGGAGVQADLYTFQDFTVHGCSVITALTAQNSFAVGYTIATERKNVVAQINALDSDLPAKAIKVGMLFNAEIVETVSKYLNDYQGYVVCDPVIISSTGGSLLEEGAGEIIRQQLLPRVDLLTANLREASTLTGIQITNTSDMLTAADALLALGAKAVVVTGGHFAEYPEAQLDYFTDGAQAYWLMGEHIDTINDHGSGCTFSSAITAALAQAYSLLDAIVLAKAYVSQGLRYSVQIGSGPGPVGHFGWPNALEDMPVLFKTLGDQGLSFPSLEEPLQLCPIISAIDELSALLLAEPVSFIRVQVDHMLESDRADFVQQVLSLCQASQVKVIVDSDWQLAIACQAHGVHMQPEALQQQALLAIQQDGLLLGVSASSYADIARVDAVEPSYIEFNVPANDAGIEQLEEWVTLLADYYPLMAYLEGDAKLARQLMATGVDGLSLLADSLNAELDAMTATL